MPEYDSGLAQQIIEQDRYSVKPLVIGVMGLFLFGMVSGATLYHVGMTMDFILFLLLISNILGPTVLIISRKARANLMIKIARIIGWFLTISTGLFLLALLATILVEYMIPGIGP